MGGKGNEEDVGRGGNILQSGHWLATSKPGAASKSSCYQPVKGPHKRCRVPLTETGMRERLVPLILECVITESLPHLVYPSAGTESLQNNISFRELTIDRLSNEALPAYMGNGQNNYREPVLKILNETWSLREKNCKNSRELLSTILELLQVEEAKKVEIMAYFDSTTISRLKIKNSGMDR